MDPLTMLRKPIRVNAVKIQTETKTKENDKRKKRLKRQEQKKEMDFSNLVKERMEILNREMPGSCQEILTLFQVGD